MTVNRSEFAVFIRPFVPDGHFVVLEILYVGVSRYEPEEFVYDGFQMNFLCGQQREAFLKIETHLIAEDALGSHACTVCLNGAVFPYMAEKVKVLLHS